MEEKIAALRAELEADLAAVHNKDELSAFWQKYLSKNGSVTGLTKSLRDVPKEERPAAGKTINEFKVWVEGLYMLCWLPCWNGRPACRCWAICPTCRMLPLRAAT